MFEGWSPAALLVHAASLLYVLGFLVRDQIKLRALVLVGTALYIAYYYIVPDIPLWDAIFWSAILGLANAYTMISIIRDRTPARYSEEDLILFSAIPGIGTNDFKRMMRIADKFDAKDRVELTYEGKPLAYLAFVLQGTVSVYKTGQDNRTLNAPFFIGEIAYLTGQSATATTLLDEGGRLVRWNVGDLKALSERHPGIEVALERAFNRDLAVKVAAS